MYLRDIMLTDNSEKILGDIIINTLFRIKSSPRHGIESFFQNTFQGIIYLGAVFNTDFQSISFQVRFTQFHVYSLICFLRHIRSL